MGTSEEHCRLRPLLSTPAVLVPTSPHLSPTYFTELDILLVCVCMLCGHTCGEVLVHMHVHSRGDQRLTKESSAILHRIYRGRISHSSPELISPSSLAIQLF